MSWSKQFSSLDEFTHRPSQTGLSQEQQHQYDVLGKLVDAAIRSGIVKGDVSISMGGHTEAGYKNASVNFSINPKIVKTTKKS